MKGPYLGASHSLSSFFVSEPEFRANLYWNLLLSPFGISLPLHSMFSPYFSKEVIRPHCSNSWVYTAIEKRLCSVLVHPGFSGFRDSANFRKEPDNKSKGLATNTDIDELSQRYSRLERVADLATPRRDYALSFKDNFTKIIRSTSESLTNHLPEQHANEFKRFWNSDVITELKSDVSDSALKACSVGLTNASLLGEMRLRFLKNTRGTSDTFNDFLDEYAKVDPENGPLVRRFCAIACDAFNLGMSDSYATPMCRPGASNDFNVVLGALDLPSKGKDDDTSVQLIAELPSSAILFTGTGEQMLRCREKGRDYFSAYETWLTRPNSNSRDKLVSELRWYCQDICLEFGSGANVGEFGKHLSGIEKYAHDHVGRVSGAVAGGAMEYGLSGGTAVGAAAGLALESLAEGVAEISIGKPIKSFLRARNIERKSRIFMNIKSHIEVA